MSWKFKASKYKNTVPVEPKFDKHIRELSIGAGFSDNLSFKFVIFWVQNRFLGNYP